MPAKEIPGYGHLNFGTAVTLPLYTGGRIPAQTHLAEAKRRLAQVSAGDVELQLIYGVAASYARLFQIEHDIEAVQHSVEALREAQRDQASMLKVGKVARVDLLKVDARLSDLQTQLIDLDNARQTEAGQLNALLGRSVETPVTVEDHLLQPAVTIPLDQALVRAREQNPDYRVGQQQVEIAKRNTELTATGLNPSVSVVGGYFANSASPFYQYGDDPVALLVFSFPLFDHTITERTHEADSRTEERRADLRQLGYDIEQRTQAAYLAVKDAQARIHSTADGAAWAKEALRIELLKERLGREIVEHLLDAQAALLNNEAQNDRALADYTTAVAALQHETGINFFQVVTTR